MFNHNFDRDIFDNTEMSYNIDPATHYFLPGQQYFLTYPEEHDFKIKPNPGITYGLNGDGHRSDEFEPLDNNKTNILFAGCSSTFGEGIPEDTRWTNRVHSSFDNVGPLQVLGYPGGGADRIVSNILKYCSKYGKPDYIFVMFADFSRHIEFIRRGDDTGFRNVLMFNYRNNTINIDDNKMETLLFQFQNYLRILEIFCETNGIKLYTSSWDSLTSEQARSLDLKTFSAIPFNELTEYFLSLTKNDLVGLDKSLFFLARDGHHDGTIRHRFVADYFIERAGYDKKD